MGTTSALQAQWPGAAWGAGSYD